MAGTKLTFGTATAFTITLNSLSSSVTVAIGDQFQVTGFTLTLD